MKKYLVKEKPLFLSAGVLGLTPAQVEGRKGSLKRIRAGQYEITAQVGFKIGEIIELDKKTIKNIIKTGALEEYEPKISDGK